jgi:hypothetical protein
MVGVTSPDPPLTPFADGLWLATGASRFLGLRLTATMALLRLGDGGLLCFSPVALTPERRAAVDALGPVAHIYAPSLLHHLHAGEWAAAFPAARVHAPAGLGKKRPDLRIDRPHGAPPEPAFAGVVDELPISGCRLGETVLFYRPAAALLVADLVHNVGRPAHAWTSLYARMMGFRDHVAVSRALRATAFPDRAAARRSLDAVLALPFDRLVVGHGEPIATGGREALAAAYAWLRS